MTQRYHLLTEELTEEIANASRHEQANWLILGPSQDFVGHWEVDSLWPEFFFDFEDIIGSYKSISPANLDVFFDHAEKGGYKVAFVEDPTIILEDFRHLNDPPPFSINSELGDTTNGLISWQIVGFNKLIKDETVKAGLVCWDTGAGKSIFIICALLWHSGFSQHNYDLGLIVCKSNNKVDTQRKLKRLADIDSIIVDGTPAKRKKTYAEIVEKMNNFEPVVVIINYEKFREDSEYIKILLERRKVLFFWDEMPMRLSNRSSMLYQKVKKAIYTTFSSKPRPVWMRHWELTATPIVNDPSEQYNCIRLINPPLLGSVADFESQYVAYHHPISGKPVAFRNLDKLEAKLGHMTHRVSRKDPEVAALFPQVMSDLITIDWNDKHRALYDRLTGKAKSLMESGDTDFSEDNILSIIQVMQMICDAPSMIAQSAKNREAFLAFLSPSDYEGGEAPRVGSAKGSSVALKLLEGMPVDSLTDKGHTKLETLREILLEKHPDEKVIVHMTWAGYGFPPLEAKLKEWGVSYVVFTGSDKQKQEILDSFRDDPSIRVFLTGDSGSDGIDIGEATVGVNYNYPWTWVKVEQREGRRNRVNSTKDQIYTYDLVMANSIDERKKQIIDQKHKYHEALFDGRAADFSQSARTSKEDLLFILFGD
jgi:SNF2 family DNA or RNA helicase